MTHAERAELDAFARRWNDLAYVEVAPITILSSVGIKMQAHSIGVFVRGGTTGVLMFEVHATDEALAMRLVRRGLQDLITGQ
jgi:hypothetical protein